jgi:hypothetical protein
VDEEAARDREVQQLVLHRQFGQQRVALVVLAVGLVDAAREEIEAPSHEHAEQAFVFVAVARDDGEAASARRNKR